MSVKEGQHIRISPLGLDTSPGSILGLKPFLPEARAGTWLLAGQEATHFGLESALISQGHHIRQAMEKACPNNSNTFFSLNFVSQQPKSGDGALDFSVQTAQTSTKGPFALTSIVEYVT